MNPKHKFLIFCHIPDGTQNSPNLFHYQEWKEAYLKRHNLVLSFQETPCEMLCACVFVLCASRAVLLNTSLHTNHHEMMLKVDSDVLGREWVPRVWISKTLLCGLILLAQIPLEDYSLPLSNLCIRKLSWTSGLIFSSRREYNEVEGIEFRVNLVG